MIKPLKENEHWWTTNKLETYLGVSYGCCATWIRRGLIKAIKTSPNGVYRIHPDEARRFLRERGIEI